MKLLGSTKSKITKDENDENVPYLEITEVVLVHCVKSDTIFTSIKRSNICKELWILSFAKNMGENLGKKIS